MPAPPSLVDASTPAFIANVVGLVMKHAAEQGLSRAITDVARTHGLAVETVDKWVSRAYGVTTALVPPGLLVCGMCAQPMILILIFPDEQVYLCAPPCDRDAVPAQEIRDAIAARVWHRTPYLVPPGAAEHAADYAPGAMHRVALGAIGSRELDITWRAHPLMVLGHAGR